MNYCRNCGTTNPQGASFCGNCGAPVEKSFGMPSPHPGYSSPPPQAGASGKSIAAMILGLFSIIGSCGPVTGIIAIILANQELRDIREGRSSAAGETMAKVGLWTGWIGTIVCGLFWIVYMAIIFLAAMSNI